MKRRIALGTAVTLGALVLATSIHAFAADISSNRAKEIALEHAKTKESDLVFSKVEQDYDDRRLVYEVEFVTSGGTEYDYEIEAATGNIIAYDHDAEYYVPAGKEAGVSGAASGSRPPNFCRSAAARNRPDCSRRFCCCAAPFP